MEYYTPKEVKDAIIYFIAHNNMTIKDFCKLCNISKTTYYKLISGTNVRIKKDTIKSLQKASVL